MDTEAQQSDALVQPRDVRVRAVWENLSSPVAIAFVTDESVTLVDEAGVAALGDHDATLRIGDLLLGGTVAERRELLDEAREIPRRDYAEMGDVDVVAVGGEIELRRLPGDGLQETGAAVVAALLEHERSGWVNRGVSYAKWSFDCGGKHFVTTPLRAAFIADRITKALERNSRRGA